MGGLSSNYSFDESVRSLSCLSSPGCCSQKEQIRVPISHRQHLGITDSGLALTHGIVLLQPQAEAEICKCYAKK